MLHKLVIVQRLKHIMRTMMSCETFTLENNNTTICYNGLSPEEPGNEAKTDMASGILRCTISSVVEEKRNYN